MDINQNDDVLSKQNVYKLLTACNATIKEDLSETLQDFKDEKHPKLSMAKFFEFMKTAYQVNDSFESLVTMLNINSEIDWNKLAKVSLKLDKHDNDANKKHLFNNVICRDKGTDISNEALIETYNEKSVHIKANVLESSRFPTSPSSKLYFTHEELNSKEADLLSKGYNNYLVPNRNEIHPERCDQVETDQSQIEDTKVVRPVDVSENIITKMMKANLSDVMHEGLLDSILPYMIPKANASQPVIKKSITNTEVKKSISLSTNVETKTITSATHKEKDRDRTKISKKCLENEVEIHVCDEEKNIKKNFRCPQKLLIQKMCYFADVTAGQKLEEIDISVHCDVVIFDWLMRWVKKDIIKKSEWPNLEAINVIPIMVSASFLQMEPLLENCLQYCYDNMSDILKTSTILTCLDDSLLTRLAERFTNDDVETLKDKKDKIQSKLFCKLITFLVDVIPHNNKGHYSSLATLFKCSKCGKNIIQSISHYVPCIATAMKIDSNGIIHSHHVRDLTWTLNDYIVNLRAELRSWRKVYWRLWGDCHFLFCIQCNMYFPIHQMSWCCYHSELPQFFINEQQRPVPLPLGRFPCCSQRAYRFEVLSNVEGCKYREHIPDVRTQKDINILNIFTIHRDVVAIEPPQLFFPEKITRLVSRDPSLPLGKLICKETMWWAGIELVPQRQRLGLLGKVWSGSGFRRFIQVQDLQKPLQKMRQQVSVTTDASSVTSSTIESDEEDGGTYYDDSSVDEESYYSEESNVWSGLKSANKIKTKSTSSTVRRNSGRCWSGNLNVRHNQDNQRNFEERAATQMIALLTKRVSTDSSLFLKSSHRQWSKRNQTGGSYVKLEAEFREEINHSYKCKNFIGKCSVRTKSNKL